MEPPRDDQLIAELRALRPAPRPEFAAELDQRAAAGFPRRSRLRIKGPADLWTAIRSKGPADPRRLLLAGGGAVLAAIAVATVIAVGNQSGTSSHGLLSSTHHPDTHRSEQPTSKSSAAAEESGTQFEAEAPVVPSEAGATNGAFVPGPTPERLSSARHRDVERSAEVVLGAEPKDVADDAAKVFAAVHASDGIVMRSSTRQGKAGGAGATFELLIPSAKLPDALAAFSEIDAVRSRHEATADITAPTVSAAELLQESRARIDSLLGQLEAAEIESEREAVEAELRHERRHAARLAAQLDHLHKRADYSRVSLRIVTGETEESTGGGAWGIGDAFHDAGQVLAIAAAVTVVALAILGPIVLIALLAWLTHRAWVRRERRRVLG